MNESITGRLTVATFVGAVLSACLLAAGEPGLPDPRPSLNTADVASPSATRRLHRTTPARPHRTPAHPPHGSRGTEKV